jgi:hypothetical protein
VKVKKIKLKDSMPDRLTVELTVEELAHITKWVGGHSPSDMPNGLESFYWDATGTFFNRFWENGLNGCLDGDDE